MMESNNILKVAAIQADILWENLQGNLEKYSRMLDTLSPDTDLVVLPEMFTTGFSMDPERLAEGMDGSTVAWFKQQAKQRGIALTGSFIAQENGRYYNRLVFVEPSGMLHLYDKRHLFRVGEEHNHYSAGAQQLVVNYRGWRIRPLICYDLRFPVWSRSRNDYDLLIYVANWPDSRRDVWTTLLKARAIENQACLVGVNRVGSDGMGLTYAGDSVLMNAKGQPLDTSIGRKDKILMAEFSMTELLAFRLKFPAWHDADDFSIV
ncbi:MAG TPA: amidohydrolase [Williamwhitmania sp.]|nr:amidohydrolase [Williamwhitmania sp.]